MATNTPYARLVGVWRIWTAASGTAIPDLDASPSGSWTELGRTDEDQTLNWTGSLTALTDNHTNGPVKHIRPEEGFSFGGSLVHMTLEDLATIFSKAAASVSSTTSGAYNIKQMGLKRGYLPNRFALLARGGAVEATNTLSGYMAGEAQLYIPLGVFDGEPTATFSKGGSPALEFMFVAEHDDSQSAGNNFGYLQMRTS